MPGPQLAHGQELEDAVLHLVEPVVVVGEHTRSTTEVGVVGGRRAPRQRHQPVEVVADHAVLAGLDRRRLQARHLLARTPQRRLRQLRLLDRLLEALDLECARILLVAELAADDLQLLAQEVVLLRLLGLVADLGEDLLVERDQLALGHRELQRQLEALGYVDLFEQPLAVGDLAHDAGGEVGELARILDVEQRRGEAVVLLLLQLGELAQLLLQQPEQRGRPLALGRDLDQFLRAHDEVRLLAHDLGDARAPQALRHRRHAAVRQLQRLQDAGDDADLVQVGRGLDVLLGVLLQHQEQVAVVGLGLGDDLARHRRVEQQRHHQLRERHRPAQREHEHRVGQRVLHDDRAGCAFALEHDGASAGAGVAGTAAVATAAVATAAVAIVTAATAGATAARTIGRRGRSRVFGAFGSHGGTGCRPARRATEGTHSGPVGGCTCGSEQQPSNTAEKRTRVHEPSRDIHATTLTVPACPSWERLAWTKRPVHPKKGRMHGPRNTRGRS
jgi:hypothetical protein